MRRQLLVIAVILAMAACGKGTISWDGTTFGEGPGAGGGSAGGVGAGGGGGGNLPAIQADLPCDVALLLSEDCAACHGAVPQPGLLRLVTRADLVAASPVNPAHSVAEWAAARVDAGQMPPAGSPPLLDGGLAVLQGWIAAGLAAGTCAVSPGDGGTWTPPDGGGWDGGVLAGLPCDVAAMVASSCVGCHYGGSANLPLLSLADFQAPSPTTSGLTMAASAVQRLASSTSPMPPVGNPRPSAAEVTAFDAWVAAGLPSGTCGSVDAGVGDGGLAPTTCSSGVFWTGGNRESPDMNPGRPCLACHLREDPDKHYPFSGTVFPTRHEQDLCTDALASGPFIQILDAQGVVQVTMYPSRVSGNFRSPLDAGVLLPYTARAWRNGVYTEMTTPQTDGDCNGCHTEQGANKATGRIVLP